MIKISPFLPLLLLLACNNNSDQQAITDDSVATELLGWRSTLNDTTMKLEMKKMEPVDADSLDPVTITKFLNSRNSRVTIEWQRQSNDTAYLKIADATVLTQQMGTTGAMMYMAFVVYNVTELPGIRFVTLSFDEGDHAVPGTYTRESFKDE